MLKVAKKYILSFSDDKEKEIFELIKKGWHIEVVDSNKESKEEIQKELQEINHEISNIDFAISYLSFFSEKESVINKIKNPRIVLKEKDIENFKKTDFLVSLVKNVINCEKELGDLEKENKEKENILKELEKFGNLSFVPRETDHTVSFVLQQNKKKEQEFKEQCLKEGVFFKEINPGFFAVISLKGKKIPGRIVEYHFSNVPQKEREILTKQIEESRNRESEIKNNLKKMAESLAELKIYHDILCLKRREIEVKKKSLDYNFLNYIIFWADEEEKNLLQKKLSGKARIIEMELGKDEFPPVFLENAKWSDPFQSVTNIFGLPGFKEIDPTPYLAFFFIIFFGICLTDAGYGALLVLFTGIPLLVFKKRFKKNKLLRLLFYGGISTFIMGVLFGSYFGVGPEVLHVSFMKNFKIIDPIKDTVLFMSVTFLLGYLQICFSQVVKMIRSLKAKEKSDFVSGLVWLAFYLSGGIYLLSLYFPFLRIVGFSGLIIFAIGLFLVESRGQKIILKPLVGAIKILQGLIGTMSDILSYSRLMALGLGTGVIALIVNQIAFLLGGMIPYVGWVVVVLILIGGHLFNLGINALGGFIHSARLQFVEFFPKFMEGGGRRLDSIGQELKYIEIN
jgi:V/A-type H+/Na+-transporting ATPase subunit I